MKNINYAKLKKAELVDIINSYEGEIDGYEKQMSQLHKELLKQDDIDDTERAEMALRCLETSDRLDTAKAWRNVAWSLAALAIAALIVIIVK
jgi:hypothetical protein